MAIIIFFKRLIRKIVKFFNHEEFKSATREYWVNHTYDETIHFKEAAGGWCNVHGFEGIDSSCPDGWRRWVGLDYRWLGIRIQDVVIECKTKAMYDKWLHNAHYNTHSVINGVLEDSALDGRKGDNVNIEWVFRWGDDDKSFDVHLSGDRYAIEK